MVLLTALTIKNFEFHKSKMADGRRLEKPLNRHIYATFWPILMKFGMMTHIVPYSGKVVKISNFWKFKMAAAAMLKITKKSWYIRNGLTDLYEI